MLRLPHRVRTYADQLRLRRAPFVFVHINKTGGSSVEKALGLPFQHRTALEIRADLGQRLWDERFKFTVIRNPWDKVASHYHYRVKTNQTGLGDHPIPFTEWVRRAYGDREPRYHDQPKMFMPQVDWICDESGTVIVDFIGRFERLNDDFHTACQHIGRRAELPHLKKSQNRDYRREYDTASVDIVAERFAGDVSEFGYSFE
jgi:chondroitin 4-sulfotransferase 11